MTLARYPRGSLPYPYVTVLRGVLCATSGNHSSRPLQSTRLIWLVYPVAQSGAFPAIKERILASAPV